MESKAIRLYQFGTTTTIAFFAVKKLVLKLE